MVEQTLHSLVATYVCIFVFNTYIHICIYKYIEREMSEGERYVGADQVALLKRHRLVQRQVFPDALACSAGATFIQCIPKLASIHTVKGGHLYTTAP